MPETRLKLPSRNSPQTKEASESQITRQLESVGAAHRLLIIPIICSSLNRDLFIIRLQIVGRILLKSGGALRPQVNRQSVKNSGYICGFVACWMATSENICLLFKKKSLLTKRRFQAFAQSTAW
ncbi:MAG: hypothetical protein WBG95_09965, partial [Sulfitobacter sp.]